MDTNTRPWFWGGVTYQIYPRSFQDSNGDGIGDLNGIISRLDYLAGLGIKAIWLCPFYPSPMADFGYDISDYLDVDPLFGSLDDFKNLVNIAHSKGIRVIIDLVANHTSDEHAWFKESRSSRDNPKRDWYIWQNTHASGAPPNNWRSVFGGSAWEYDSITNQFYLHSFSHKQPDLNWDNPEVRQAIKSVVKFWLALGVDGFRADAVYWLSKDLQLRDDPINPGYGSLDPKEYMGLNHRFSEKGPRLYQYLKEITDSFGEYQDRFLVAEADPDGDEEIAEYLKFYNFVDPKRCAPFIFEGIHFGSDIMRFKAFADKFQAALKPDFLPAYTLGNHDKPRLASRVGPEPLRLMAMMLLSLPGMPFIYYGEEIGMADALISPQSEKDPQANDGKGRSGSRSPMQWSAEHNAGFSSGMPWISIPPSYSQTNVQAEMADKESLLNLYKRLIKLRNESPALRYGNYQPLGLGKDIYGFVRDDDNQRMVILLNFRSTAASVALGQLSGQVMLSSLSGALGAELTPSMTLAPHEGLIIRVDK